MILSLNQEFSFVVNMFLSEAPDTVFTKEIIKVRVCCN